MGRTFKSSFLYNFIKEEPNNQTTNNNNNKKNEHNGHIDCKTFANKIINSYEHSTTITAKKTTEKTANLDEFVGQK